MARSRKPASVGEAYVDSSAFVAFLDRSDSYHDLFKRLFAAPPRLITTALVIAETHAWFLRRYDRTRALQFLGMAEALTPLVVLPAGPKEVSAAANVMRRLSDQDLTMADALGLHVLARRKIRFCWSTDYHLGLTGASLVIHSS